MEICLSSLVVTDFCCSYVDDRSPVAPHNDLCSLRRALLCSSVGCHICRPCRPSCLVQAERRLGICEALRICLAVDASAAGCD